MESFSASKSLQKVVIYLKSTGLPAALMQMVGQHDAGCGILPTDLGRL